MCKDGLWRQNAYTDMYLLGYSAMAQNQQAEIKVKT